MSVKARQQAIARLRESLQPGDPAWYGSSRIPVVVVRMAIVIASGADGYNEEYDCLVRYADDSEGWVRLADLSPRHA